MHPEISKLPSMLFYNNRLKDGPDMDTKTRQKWHNSALLGPYRFFNVANGVEEQGRNHSLINRAECEAAAAIFEVMRRDFRDIDLSFRVGIVTMYRAQMFQMKSSFTTRFGQEVAASIDFNTVDGFQGQEKDVIILSCVRAGPGIERVGFLAGESIYPSHVCDH